LASRNYGDSALNWFRTPSVVSGVTGIRFADLGPVQPPPLKIFPLFI
jgi:hypothetical protein